MLFVCVPIGVCVGIRSVECSFVPQFGLIVKVLQGMFCCYNSVGMISKFVPRIY